MTDCSRMLGGKKCRSVAAPWFGLNRRCIDPDSDWIVGCIDPESNWIVGALTLIRTESSVHWPWFGLNHRCVGPDSDWIVGALTLIRTESSAHWPWFGLNHRRIDPDSDRDDPLLIASPRQRFNSFINTGNTMSAARRSIVLNRNYNSSDVAFSLRPPQLAHRSSIAIDCNNWLDERSIGYDAGET